MSEFQKNFPEFYVTAPQRCPYLPGKLERKLFTHLTRDKAPALIDNLLKGGFRRSQNIAYMPYCDNCQACVSVRVPVDEFEMSRSFRRVAARNTDLAVRRVPPRPTPEQYALFRDYIDSRHNDGGMADMSVLDYALMVEDTMVDTFVTEYRVRPESAITRGMHSGPLIAAMLCDRLSDGVSLVYSFYDVDAAERSLGTHMIVDHVAYTRSLGLPYLYLGYWIRGSTKMDYKVRFQPQERLGPGGWAREPIDDPVSS